MSFSWKHDEDDNNEYWKGLSTLHCLIKYCAFGEIILSLIIIVLLFHDYKQTYNVNLNPLNFNYSLNKNEDHMMNY